MQRLFASRQPLRTVLSSFLEQLCQLEEGNVHLLHLMGRTALAMRTALRTVKADFMIEEEFISQGLRILAREHF